MLPYADDIQDVLTTAGLMIDSLDGQTLDVLTITKPPDMEYARHLARVVSKLSPLIGNMIEFSIVSILNKQDWTRYNGSWDRQDPGFPDTIFNWDKVIKPGIEVKTWFPLATEVTARFKDSQSHFQYNQTNVAIVAWLPEYLVYGKPKIIGVFIDTAMSFALARDTHYHNPPDYLVFEPEDTSKRTSNLQQTNVNGYKFQGTQDEFDNAEKDVLSWGENASQYLYSTEYQKRVKELAGKYSYRPDTNFAKIDRIRHDGLEAFKSKIEKMPLFGHTINAWAKTHLWSDNGLSEILNSE
jgi:hypothetical protein